MLELEKLREELEKLREELETLRGNLVNISNRLSELQNEKDRKEDLSKLCTIDEKIILKNLIQDEDATWYIGKDYNGELRLHDDKPEYSAITGGNTTACYDYELYIFSHLFKFIEKGKYYKVSDLIADLEEEVELWN